jgi:twitching motility protein PilJ
MWQACWSRQNFYRSALDLPTGREKQMASNLILPKFSLRTQIVVAVVLLVLTIVTAYLNSREDRSKVGYVAQTSQLAMLSQRLAKDAQQALTGNDAAFDALSTNKAGLQEILSKLDKGDLSMPATSGDARTVLNDLLKQANVTLQNAKTLENGRADLVALGKTVAAINTSLPELRTVTEGMIDTLAVPQKDQAVRFALAMERIGKDATLTLGGEVNNDQVARLGADAVVAEESLAALPPADANVVRARKLFDGYRSGVQLVAPQVRNLSEAKAAAQAIVSDSDSLLAQAQHLMDVYQGSSAKHSATVLTWLLGLAFLALAALIAKTYTDNSRRRAEEAVRVNRQNQDGILRLMNELGDLAEGDLTVRATVSEDITGAIADSVNYTTEEFRKLVARINGAAEQMGTATKDAESISRGLLIEAQKQAKEIQGAGEAVQLMAQSIKEVDSSAARSAEVARRTLTVTQQGAQAVRNSISGMDSIREQIQDTAKRIKRLGESSQEIGEIVDLISDITEQTNVLALNAAIQAASAGEAGRGFSVVAEEVQRLAERSAEATKQIGGLVKTIQGDTHDAVAAMEKSILGVVDGAVLSDMAGQSLKEIEQVSNELATLINSISVSTQVQSDMAGEVAGVMQEILRITEHTTEGTRLTATSVAQLTSLTSDLRNSVAGFKL